MNETLRLQYSNWKQETLPKLEVDTSPTSINTLNLVINYIKQGIIDFEAGNTNFANNNFEIAAQKASVLYPEYASKALQAINIIRNSQCEIKPISQS